MKKDFKNILPWFFSWFQCNSFPSIVFDNIDIDQFCETLNLNDLQSRLTCVHQDCICCEVCSINVHKTFRFFMICLDQKDELYQEIRGNQFTAWNVFKHDARCYEMDHYLKWPCSGNVCIFWSKPADGSGILLTSCFLLDYNSFVPCQPHILTRFYLQESRFQCWQ